MHAPLPQDEPLRLAALDRYRILDTPEEREFDEVARLASVLCDTPYAAVSFVAAERQWFKAQVGLGLRQTGREVSICAHAILHDGLFEVPDTRLDTRLRGNPLVEERPGVRFYAAAPLRTLEGRPIGTLCVMDLRPRELTEVQRLALRTLAGQVMAQLELRRLLAAQRESEARARARERAHRFLLELEDTLRTLGEPGRVMDAVAARLGRHLGVRRCAYAVVEADEDHLVLAATPDGDGSPSPCRVRLSVLGADALAALRAGRALSIPDVDADPAVDASARAALRAASIGAAICVPLCREGRLVAAFGVVHPAPRRWTGDEIALVGDVAVRCRETLERLQAERRAARERRHAELALDAGRMGVWEIDPGTGEHRWGEGMAAIFGVDPTERTVSAGRFESLLHEEDRAAVAEGFERLRAQGGAMEIEYRIRRADTGETRWVLTRGARLREDPRLLAGVSVDNTSRKLAERRLLEADARKDEFLAMLAHELRNPLAPLANALHVLQRRGSLDGTDRRMLEMAGRQLRQLRRLVDDLLEVGRITRGKIELRRESVDVAAAVRAAAESVGEPFAVRGQRLALMLPPAPSHVFADPARIAQVLENLLNNASKYTPEGGSVVVEVRDEPDTVVIRVRDDGIGLEAAKIPLLFAMFSQIDATIDRSQGGLGIGLAMVRRLVALHGGSVTAESPGLGRGSTFTVRLPRGGGEEAAPAEAAGGRAAPGELRPSSPRCR